MAESWLCVACVGIVVAVEVGAAVHGVNLGHHDPSFARKLFKTGGRRNRRPRFFGLDLRGGHLDFGNSGVETFAPPLSVRLEFRLGGQVRVDRVDGVHGSSLGTVLELVFSADGPHPGLVVPATADHPEVDDTTGSFETGY